MANTLRGEVEIDLAGTKFPAALTMGTLAELESAFGCDWDQVGPQLWRIEKDQHGKPAPVPRIGPLLKFWGVITKAAGVTFDPKQIANPYDMVWPATQLLAASQQAWFGSDVAQDGGNKDGAPLSESGAGATGSASA